MVTLTTMSQMRRPKLLIDFGGLGDKLTPLTNEEAGLYIKALVAIATTGQADADVVEQHPNVARLLTITDAGYIDHAIVEALERLERERERKRRYYAKNRSVKIVEPCKTDEGKKIVDISSNWTSKNESLDVQKDEDKKLDVQKNKLDVQNDNDKNWTSKLDVWTSKNSEVIETQENNENNGIWTSKFGVWTSKSDGWAAKYIYVPENQKNNENNNIWTSKLESEKIWTSKLQNWTSNSEIWTSKSDEITENQQDERNISDNHLETNELADITSTITSTAENVQIVDNQGISQIEGQKSDAVSLTKINENENSKKSVGVYYNNIINIDIDSNLKERKKEKILKKKERKKVPLSKNSPELFENENDAKYYEIAVAFRDLIRANIQELGGTTRHVDAATWSWVDEVRLMVEADGLTIDQLRAIYRLLQSDNFWRSTILSITNLRKHANRLILKSTEHETAKRDFDRAGNTEAKIAEVMRRLANKGKMRLD